MLARESMNELDRKVLDFLEPPTKKRLKGITPVLKRQCWERNIGIGILEAYCPLCGHNKIYNNVNSGFEVAHVVASKYLNEDLTLLYAFPSCSACNNECADLCIFDFLYCRGRLKQLKKLIMSMYELFLLSHGDELAAQDCMAWKVIDHLYGAKRFPAGGGIQNRKQILELARIEQYNLMSKEAAALAKKLARIGQEMTDLMESKIETMNLF